VQLGEHEVRARVLEGAARAFAARGLRATTVEDVLAAAGVARRTFYRVYASKEDVALALYQFGTELLLGACRQAVAGAADPRSGFAGCVDAHLGNAREFGRLIFVLGGEAQRHESPLHARRMAVHAELVDLLAELTGGAVDRLLLHGLVLALEGLTRQVLADGDEGRDPSAAELVRVGAVVKQMAGAVLTLASEVAGDP
jgi:AcrR family transcriptional regulator